MDRKIISLIAALLVLSGCKSDKTIPTAPVTGPTMTSEPAEPPIVSPSVTMAPTPKLIPPLTDAAYEEGATVTIVKSQEAYAMDITEAEIDELVSRVLFATDEFQNLIHDGQTVVVKPNLVQMRVDSTGELLAQTVNGVTTDWRVTHAVIKQVRELNPNGKIYLMEGSATGRTKDVMEHFHYTSETMPEADGFFGFEEDCGAWQDFDAPEVVKVSLPNGLLHKEYYFSKTLYDADVVISVPCLKTTSGAVVTAGIKNVCLGTPPGNIYGVSATDPGKTSMVSHKILDGELDKWIYDYYLCKPVDYVLVDGLQGFQNGPVPMGRERAEGDRMNMRVVLGGADAVAVDTMCALLMGWDPESVGYLSHFSDHAIGSGNPANILVRGEHVDTLRTPFAIYYPNLGGVPITDTEGPALGDVTYTSKGETGTVSFTTNADAVKAELYIDGFFRALIPVENAEGSFVIDLAQLPEGTHEITVCVFDRFLNKTEETHILQH